MNDKPHIVNLDKIGTIDLGYITPVEKENLPFKVKRIYWTYYTPESIERGGHSHIKLQQILIAVAGTIILKTQMPGKDPVEFVLDSPNKGLFIPRLCWREMKYTHNAVQVCIASMEYTESDYIRDYEEFKARVNE